LKTLWSSEPQKIQGSPINGCPERHGVVLGAWKRKLVAFRAQW
jgi:hypothetical protein